MHLQLLIRASPRCLPCGPKQSNFYRVLRRQQSSSPEPNNLAKRKPAAEVGAEAHTEPHLAKQIAEQPGPDATSPIPAPNIVTPLPFWQRLGPLTRAGQAYARAQRARPWATQVASALVIYLCADFGAQRMSASGQTDASDDKVSGEEQGAEKGGRKHDWARTARSLAIGGSAAIPGYIWFSFLARSFNYSSLLLSVGVKVAVNQLTFTPLFNVYFFGAQALLSGDSAAEAWRRVCNTVPVSWVNSCKLWPAVTAFNFAFIPFEYRSIFGGVVAVGWQTYLSFLNGRAEKLEALRQDEPVAADSTKLLKSAPVEGKSLASARLQMPELTAQKQAA
ncbi:hypothetical protein F4808DRAFT_117357 [Astrocystis sublimbata]|nr:hypothetical protein F4808DRAFT_117357 [Astrocystis sublimbata]